MNSYKTLYEIINIINNEGVQIEFEDRKKLGYKTYNTPNHAEVLYFFNRADDMNWDAQVFGYKRQFKFNRKFNTKKIVGLIWIPNGNHKLLLKLAERGFSKKRFIKQLYNYIKNYRILNNIPNVQYIQFN